MPGARARGLRIPDRGVACSIGLQNEKAPQSAGPLWSRASRSGCGRLFGLRRIDADLVAPLALVLELHDALDERVDRVVRADADVAARVPLGAALPDDDVAGDDALAAKLLDAAVLRVAVTPVPRRADTFLMSHGRLA